MMHVRGEKRDPPPIGNCRSWVDREAWYPFELFLYYSVLGRFSIIITGRHQARGNCPCTVQYESEDDNHQQRITEIGVFTQTWRKKGLMGKSSSQEIKLIMPSNDECSVLTFFLAFCFARVACAWSKLAFSSSTIACASATFAFASSTCAFAYLRFERSFS